MDFIFNVGINFCGPVIKIVAIPDASNISRLYVLHPNVVKHEICHYDILYARTGTIHNSDPFHHSDADLIAGTQQDMTISY